MEKGSLKSLRKGHYIDEILISNFNTLYIGLCFSSMKIVFQVVRVLPWLGKIHLQTVGVGLRIKATYWFVDAL